MIFKQMNTAAIHDISGVGKCSITVALPVLSACGVETAIMPTAVLSTHTGGFTGFTYRDLTEDMLPTARHWKEVGCSFDSLYTGFLGSGEQIEIVKEIFTMFKNENNVIIVDPVMGDNGKIYQTYTKAMADGMRELCERADIVVPNITEACYMLKMEYKDGPYEREYIEDILRGLYAMGPNKAILTGVSFDDEKLGAACYDGDKIEYFLLDKIEGHYHGTGDLFCSVLLGGILNGMDIFSACEIATEFTWKSIEATHLHSKDFKFGPKFECVLPWLAQKMEDKRKCLQNQLS